MPEYRIYWDIGYGKMSEDVEADSHDEAVDMAYAQAKEDFENCAEYGAHELDGSEEDED